MLIPSAAVALGLAHHPPQLDGLRRVRMGTLAVQLFADGAAHLQIGPDDRPILAAFVRPGEEGHQIVAAHRFAPVAGADRETLRAALVRLVSPARAELALDRLALAPHRASPTPWGDVLTCSAVQPGVYHVVTQQHSGYWVDAEVLAALPLPARLDGGWYEQDVQGAILAAVLGWCPHDATLQRRLRAVLRRHYPELLALLGDHG